MDVVNGEIRPETSTEQAILGLAYRVAPHGQTAEATISSDVNLLSVLTSEVHDELRPYANHERYFVIKGLEHLIKTERDGLVGRLAREALTEIALKGVERSAGKD